MKRVLSVNMIIAALVVATLGLVCASSARAHGDVIVERVAGLERGDFVNNNHATGDPELEATHIAPSYEWVNPHTGELYFIDGGHDDAWETSVIKRVNFNSRRAEIVAGTWSEPGLLGDGNAKDANIWATSPVFHPHTGELFFIDFYMGQPRIRKLTSDMSQIKTVAGVRGEHRRVNDEEEALRKHFVNPHELTFDPITGELYFIDGQVIYKLTADGSRVLRVAGIDPSSESGHTVEAFHEGLALEAQIKPSELTFDPTSGELYFIDQEVLIRRLSSDKSYLETVAGTGDKLKGEQSPDVGGYWSRATGQKVSWADFYRDRTPKGTNIWPDQLTFDPIIGDLYFMDGDGGLIRRLHHGMTRLETVAGNQDPDDPVFGHKDDDGDWSPTGAWQEANNRGAASETSIAVTHLAFHPKSRQLYFRDGFYNSHEYRIRKLDTERRQITTVKEFDFQSDKEFMFDPHGGALYFTHRFAIYAVFELEEAVEPPFEQVVRNALVKQELTGPLGRNSRRDLTGAHSNQWLRKLKTEKRAERLAETATRDREEARLEEDQSDRAKKRSTWSEESSDGE